jgi:AcrR family transcriptional regulator
MARTVNPEEYSLKRNEILDAAQKLIYTRGYDQMTIQDILGMVAISKGAFYHYFESKPALLEALVERMESEIFDALQAVVEDPTLNAQEKMARYFDTGARWKTSHKEYLTEILRIWYSDENSLVRQKMLASGTRWLTPMLAKIVRQGIDEGVYDTPHPDQVGAILVALFSSLGDTFAEMILSPPGGEEQEAQMRDAEEALKAHTHALERVLGAAPGTLNIIDFAMIREWIPREPKETKLPAQAVQAET